MAESPNKFDRALGALVGIPDVIHTSPTTVRASSPIIGSAQTFIVQTYRQMTDTGERRESGDTVFLEYVDESGTVRMVIPPAVTKVIARQRDSLTARSRSKAAQAAAEDRKARGIQPVFMKKKGKP